MNPFVVNPLRAEFLAKFAQQEERRTESQTTILQALSLMNDSQVVVNRVHRNTANSTVAKVLAATSDATAIVDQIYLATLSRHPNATEQQQAVAYLRSGTLAQRTEDLQWVLLNSLEFLFD